MDNEKGIIFSPLDEVFKTSMIAYAEDVILDRALPRIEDGLKPVQRRILFDMYEQGLTPDKPHKKCAKIVGDVLGKFHPHGDSSVYGALVHMAQDFNMRNPLIDGHGNFGTVDGDGAAAYRYTEARMHSLALELLKDIDKDTVNFRLNFDDTIMEPDTLPGRFPNILVNGAMGIAVGLATNIPTHNLGEVIDGTVAYIENPKITLEELMKYIPAPDFPTGGYIVAGNELTEAYRTGRGKIKIRARVNIEKDTGDRQNIVITELPYQVNKASLLRKISEMREDKKDILSGISDVVDESDRNGMRAVIKIKKDNNAKAILTYLMKNTELETSFGINMVAIAHGKPCQLGLLDIISYYVNYQREVVLRRSKFDLERAKERAHIVEGLIIAVKNIDEVIKLIKSAENTADAREKLMERFSLSEVQATAILELRLSRLTKLEVFKLEEELKELNKLIKELTDVINSKARQMTIVKREMLEIKKKYADPRRSKIIDGSEIEEEHEDLERIIRNNEEYVIAITGGGLFKKMTEKNFNSSDRRVKSSSVANDFCRCKVKIKGNQTLLAFSNLGNCYKVDFNSVDECRYRDKGKKLVDVIGDIVKGEEIVALFATDGKVEGKNLLFYTTDGLVKRTEFKEYIVAKQSFQAIKLKEGEKLFAVELDRKDTTIVFTTEQGIILNCVKDDIPLQGRISAGVKGINLSKGDKLVGVYQVDDEGEIVVITDGGNYKRVIIGEIESLQRARKGVKLVTLGSGNKVVFTCHVKEPIELAVIDNFGVSFAVKTEDISIEDRTTKGKTLKNENKKRMPEKIFIL